jgi:hypothetical protein
MNILPECQDEAFEILRHRKHVCSSIRKPPPIWTRISADMPESKDHFGINIVIYNALCTVCAQYILLTEFGIRFFYRFGFRRTFDIYSSKLVLGVRLGGFKASNICGLEHT